MNPNELLVWLSAKGEGTWSRYRVAIDELADTDGSGSSIDDAGEDVPEAGSLPQHLRFKLNLERLGHAEFFCREFPNGWRVAPPTIVAMPMCEETRGFLCGARTNKLIMDLRQLIGEDNVLVTSQEECPDRIALATSTLSELSDVATKAQLFYQEEGIGRLLTALPPVDNIQMRNKSELPFGTDWQVSRFSASNLAWVDSSIDEARDRVFGLFRIHVRFRPEYFIKLRGRSYKLPVQVGKYIVLKHAHRKILHYDYGRRVLSMPVSCRPPLLLDRALTLCTGLIPKIVDGRLEYLSVEPRHSRAAKRILRQ